MKTPFTLDSLFLTSIESIKELRVYGKKLWVAKEASGKLYLLRINSYIKRKGGITGCKINLSHLFWGKVRSRKFPLLASTVFGERSTPDTFIV